MVDVSCLSFVLFFLCHIRLPFFPSCRPQSVPNNNRNNKTEKKKRNIESATPLLPLFPFGGGKRLKSLPGLVDGGASEAAIFVLFLFGVVAWS